MKIYIDTTNGTWGSATDLRIIEVTDAESLLDQMNDSEIADYGLQYGEEPS